MAEFTYIYRTSEGERLEATIEAASRDEAFAALRTQGIRPIKVIAADGSKENGEAAKRRRLPIIAVVAVVLLGIAVSFMVGRKSSKPVQIVDDGVKVTTSVANPLERQRIPGDRRRIEQAVNAFRFKTETILAQFAEPGRAFTMPQDEAVDDQTECLATSLQIASNELSEQIDLKRIVTGMKRELKAYLAAGGTWEEYLSELVKRQKLEISYRENAEKRVSDALEGKEPDLAKAYDLWLKANAQLESMGIYPMPIPDALRGYQQQLDFDE